MNERQLLQLDMVRIIERAMKLTSDHKLCCECPEEKLEQAFLKTAVRLSKMCDRLERLEAHKRARTNCGVNPPCVKSSSPES